MDTKQLGLLGELKAQYDFTKYGWTVVTPIGNFKSYDFIVLKDNTMLKIQVKTTEKVNNGVMKFSIDSKNEYRHKIYNKNDFDLYYLYCLENEQGYLYPLKDSPNTAIHLRIQDTKSNQKKNVHFAKDFEFETQIKRFNMPP